MKKQQLDKNGFLKTERGLLFANIFSLALNVTSLLGILVAIIMDESKAVPYDAVLATAATSLGLGAVGVAGAITTNVVENRLEKKKTKSTTADIVEKAIKEVEAEEAQNQ